MRVTTIITIILALLLCAVNSTSVRAERATQEEMELVCQNWLSYMLHQKGTWAGNAQPRIIEAVEMIEDNTLLARCFYIYPEGFVIVPVLKELPPVKAYSEKGHLDVNADGGIAQLLREVLLSRINLFIRVYGSLDEVQPKTGDVLLGREHKAEWNRFSKTQQEFKTDLYEGKFSPMTQAGPLLRTSWHQRSPYYNLCPMGDGGRCVVGCVATATAQIMRYWNWPPSGTGSHSYWWNGDNSCGGSTSGQWLSADFSDPYDWENMPDSCDLGCSPEESAALAELNYEVGVAFDMDYGACGSGTWTYMALNVFPTYFRYDPGIDEEDRDQHNTAEWFSIIQEEINNNRPIQYRIRSHSIVCDGWRDTGGQNQYHMNYGWGGSASAWYSIDSLYCYWVMPDSLCPWDEEYLIRNIYPLHDPIPFASAINYEVGDGPRSVFCSDLNRDTYLDLAVTNRWTESVSILLNNGDGSFQAKVDYGAGDDPLSIFCADLDGDADLDLAVTNEYSNSVSVLKNNGDGTFLPKVDYAVGIRPSSVFCADLDGDCDLDMAVVNFDSDSVSILKNNGDGTFQAKTDYSTGEHPNSVSCADLDGDSDLDLVVANYYGDNVSIFKNNGDATFQSKVDYGTGHRPGIVFCAHLDPDSYLDLVVQNWGANSVSVLINNGDGSFQANVDYDAGTVPYSVFCADLDGDLDLDIAVANIESDDVSILRNNGDGILQTKLDYAVGDGPHSIFCADLDGDSDLDIAVANLSSDDVSILENLTQIPGNSPPYPFPLISPVDGDTTSNVTEFQWAMTQDVNLSDQLRYDLYVSTVPDFNPDSTTVYDSLICSRHTDTLHVDTYYWKVKAYDNWGAETWSDQTWQFVYFIRGDVTADEIVDLADAVFLLNYLFKGGSLPDPLAAGDATCDGVVDLADVVYLLNYLFKGGEPPEC